MYLEIIGNLMVFSGSLALSITMVSLSSYYLGALQKKLDMEMRSDARFGGSYRFVALEMQGMLLLTIKIMGALSTASVALLLLRYVVILCAAFLFNVHN